MGCTRRVAKRLRAIARTDLGATAVEYALIAVLIAGVIAAVVALLGTQVGNDFHSVVDQSW